MQEAPDPNVDRGADNLVRQCLLAQPGESVHILSWQGGDLVDAVARAVERAGAVPRRVPLEAVAQGRPAQLAAELRARLHDATASVLLAGAGVPVPLSVSVIDAARAAGTRHLHIVGVDRRMFAQSIRADPERLAVMNDRLGALLEPPARVRVTSDAGTALEVSLAAPFRLVRANGRPPRGDSDNLPSGFVYTHPARVSGVFVADRSCFGSGVVRAAGGTRQSPVTFALEHSRVASVRCADAAVQASVEKYLAGHPDAGRVGIVIFPTNYLVRSEIGLDAQDELSPGMNLCLGFTESAVTRAPYDAPVQLRLVGRRLDVEVRGQRVVRAGRFEESLMEGVDPFR